MITARCAGCGGLSEGMHQARAAVTNWAIEYWKPAADAFALNNPHAHVYNGNCNVLLHRAMVKAGADDQCSASEECIAQSAALDASVAATLPLPGEVDFICGGPPCQARRLACPRRAVYCSVSRPPWLARPRISSASIDCRMLAPTY